MRLMSSKDLFPLKKCGSPTFYVQAGSIVLVLVLLTLSSLQPVKAHPSNSFLLQALTATETVTPSPTISVTTTETLQISVSPTATTDLTTTITATSSFTAVSPTGQSATPSVTPTFGLVLTLTPTTTFPPAPPELSSATPDEGTATPTPTYLPLPSVTMVYPRVTLAPELFFAQRPPEQMEKQRTPPVLNLILRFWPLGLLFFVWGILGVWLILIQYQIDE